MPLKIWEMFDKANIHNWKKGINKVIYDEMEVRTAKKVRMGTRKQRKRSKKRLLDLEWQLESLT